MTQRLRKPFIPRKWRPRTSRWLFYYDRQTGSSNSGSKDSSDEGDDDMAKDADARILRAVLRRSFPAFARKTFGTLEPGQAYVSNWHHDAIAYQLERIRCGKIRLRLSTCRLGR